MIDPLHQFQIKPILDLEVFGMNLSFSNSSLAVFFTIFVCYLFFRIGLSSNSLIPTRFQALIELMYQLVASTFEKNVGKKGKEYFPFVFSIFFFILFGNLLGMIPYMFTFTSHIIATFTLAMIVFIFVTILGFALHGAKFVSYFVPKGAPKMLLPLLIPIELLSYISRPVSLSIRLFANMMAGHTMLKVFAGFSTMMGIYGGIFPMGINVILTGFEILVAALQAYVFCVLTCLYIHDAVHLH